jgi:calcium load-activated calcium channel
MFFIAVLMMFFMSMFSTAYEGVVVAKLPFQPVSFITNITHRGIQGTDYTDCSMIFVYILANMALRPTIQKVLGFAGPRQAMQSMGIFGMPA